ncbi:hypothetical protein JX580_03500 [Thiomicrospira microaerophila]|uniref:hypothetical protein n=1 Tax=Thiomicrospira microaerophila TaxID=406020 RepID=UPI0020104D37|nr:hypothetical protein [Thiomicrospira microaerophila]UQB42968.1 hypothetical protein JX580_03500 [Thiomicrospira microaerophila]
MEVAQLTDMMYALRNPAGVPFYPIVFIALGVLTFAMHIFFVQLMLGTGAITAYGAFSNNPYWQRLASAMLEIAKVSVSVAIVIGVAPLLFVQVVYDPQWYTANVLSARWVIGFIVIMIMAYWLMYYYYFRNGKFGQGADKPKARWSIIASLAIFLLAGWIMHSLTSQMLHPELWQQWYMPNGAMDTTGSQLHANNPWRFAFFILIAIPVAGAMMVAYRRFKSVREDADHAYLNWTAELGKKWLKVGSLLVLIPYLGWMVTLPETAENFAGSIWSILPALGFIGLAVWSHLRLNDAKSICNYMVLAMAFIAVLLPSIGREVLRYDILNGFFGYNFFDYKVIIDWYSTLLFFGTFAVVGGAVLGYFLTIAWKVGQSKGVYVPSAAVDRAGTIAIWVISLWMVHFFVLGFWVWMQ